jgi:PEP-CTERM motif
MVIGVLGDRTYFAVQLPLGESLMNCAKNLRVTALVAAALAFTAVNANADFITGYGWVTTEAISMSASTASLNSTSCHGGSACIPANADVTFTTTGVNFSTGANTVAAWLASSGFTLDNVVDNVPGSPLDPTIWEFVGNISVTSPNPFTIEHDDGVTFVVNGETVIDAPGPTGAVPTPGTYTGAASGNAPFDLIYAECCSPPAVLNVSLLGPTNTPVPEPGSIILLGTATCGIVWSIRRRRRKA